MRGASFAAWLVLGLLAVPVGLAHARAARADAPSSADLVRALGGEDVTQRYDAYTQLLEEAVASLEGRAITSERDPELVCDLPAFIPDDYLPDVGQRLDFYRRFSAALDEEEIANLVIEVADRYGPPPDEVGLLADLMRIKALGRKLQCKTIELGDVRFAVALDDRTPLKPEAVLKLVQQKGSAWKLTPDMRLTRTLTDAERAQRLPVARQLLEELLALR